MKLGSMRRGCVIALLLALGCGMGRPSLDEARKELAGHIDPALQAALKGVAVRPERLTGIDHCSDPFFGPRQGVRPTLSYRIPIQALGENPKQFVFEAEKVWRDRGLTVEIDETEEVIGRFGSNDKYKMDAFVNFTNGDAMIAGSGPCVDDPNAD